MWTAWLKYQMFGEKLLWEGNVFAGPHCIKDKKKGKSSDEGPCVGADQGRSSSWVTGEKT